MSSARMRRRNQPHLEGKRTTQSPPVAPEENQHVQRSASSLLTAERSLLPAPSMSGGRPVHELPAHREARLGAGDELQQRRSAVLGDATSPLERLADLSRVRDALAPTTHRARQV